MSPTKRSPSQYNHSFHLKLDGYRNNLSGFIEAVQKLTSVSHRYGGDGSYPVPFFVISSGFRDKTVSIGCENEGKETELRKGLTQYLREQKK